MGGGGGTQKIVYQQWPDTVLPTANSVFSHNRPFGLGGGEVGLWVGGGVSIRESIFVSSFSQLQKAWGPELAVGGRPTAVGS